MRTARWIWVNEYQETSKNYTVTRTKRNTEKVCGYLQIKWLNEVNWWGGQGRCFIHTTLQWRHNERNGVSNHQPHNCLLNRVFRRRSKKTSKPLRHWPLWGEFTDDRWIPRTKEPVTQKRFPFDDVIMTGLFIVHITPIRICTWFCHALFCYVLINV